MFQHTSAFLALASAFAMGACGDDDDSAAADASVAVDAAPDATGEIGADLERDILLTALTVDVTAMTARAELTVAAAESGAVSFEIGDLDIAAVSDGAGSALRFADLGDRLDVAVASTAEMTIVVDYAYRGHGQFDGVIANGLTFTWPYYCGNVFPCHAKASPADGTRFALTLTGVPDGAVAVYPASIPTAAPAYMLAWAVGAYTFLPLGETKAGTEVGAWYLPGELVATTAGTEHLREAFEWYETTIGPYLFGDVVASVAAPWGPGAYGGMEHHPLWHVATGAMGDQETHAHEAAHGWFGDGVRLRCWEDFVLSEGTVTYLAARALEAADAALGAEIWTSYEARLGAVPDGQIAWPGGCGAVDVLDIFNDAPYIKGAFFYLAVEERIGRPALDAALAAFYAEYGGAAAGMQDLLDAIETASGWDPGACASKWLMAETVPVERACE